jgi:hypothetical protein
LKFAKNGKLGEMVKRKGNIIENNVSGAEK